MFKIYTCTLLVKILECVIFYSSKKPKQKISHFYISILELFLKDHMTLKTGIMATENSALPPQEYITF